MEVVNTCADKNGGCDQKCRHGPGGPICSCYAGYELDADGKTCNGKYLPNNASFIERSSEE